MSSSGITFESPSNSPPPPPPPPSSAVAEPRATGQNPAGVPKFKSFPPPSLPISPSLFKPSSYFSITGALTAGDLLDSPVLLSSSHILPSPTTGSFPLHAFNWNPNNQNQNQKHGMKKEQSNFTDFQPQTQLNSLKETYQQPRIAEDRKLVKTEYPLVKTEYPLQKQSIKPNYAGDHSNYNNQSIQKKLNDGYNWRKYGQKQVKGSKNPRSYYKCTYQNCSMRKKVETSSDGDITEIVYKGNHNHPKPQSNKRSSSSLNLNNSVGVRQLNDFSDRCSGSREWELVGTPENSSVSIGDGEVDRSRSDGDGFVEDEIQAKRLKMESENEGISIEETKTVREPRLVVQTVSDIDILIDGYRWRKYGQKVVKGNSNPRSYYKCTTPGCSVRKHVERASHDLRSVITTYEGRHTHDVPVARGVSRLPSNQPTLSHQSELSYQDPNNSMINETRGSRLPTLSETQFTLDMLHSQGGIGFSGFENPIQSNYMDRQLDPGNVFSKAKDDNFLESFIW